jgi:anti-repressor protein
MQKPKVRFAEAVTGSDGSILIGELAKLITQNGYEIGRTRLFDWLRMNGYLFKNSTEPIQKWVEKGLFETKVSLIHTHHGEHEVLTTKVTGKGQRYFIDVFLSKKL